MNPAPATLHLQINGEPHTAPAGQRLPELLEGLGLPPQAVLVEHNGCALLRAEWSTLVLADGDHLEVLRIVAGG